jgi:hypothetical protein
MEVWDASIRWRTLVVRAPTAAEAREIAIESCGGGKGLSAMGFDIPELTDEWPRRLDPDGPSAVLVEGNE